MRFRQRTINELAGMICGYDISDPTTFTLTDCSGKPLCLRLMPGEAVDLAGYLLQAAKWIEDRECTR
jgi:hypothetical protein